MGDDIEREDGDEGEPEGPRPSADVTTRAPSAPDSRTATDTATDTVQLPGTARRALWAGWALLGSGALLMGAAVAVFVALGEGSAALYTGIVLEIVGVGLLVFGAERRTLGLSLSRRSKPRRTSIGALPLLQRSLAIPLQVGFGSFLATFPLLLPRMMNDPMLGWGLGVSAIAIIVQLVMFDFLAWRRGILTQPGVRGRKRVVAGSLSNLAFLGLLGVPVGLLALGTLRATESGFLFSYTLEEPFLALSPHLRTLLIVHAVILLVANSVDGWLTLSAWFLLPTRARKIFWGLFDLATIVGFGWATWTLPMRPGGEGLEHLRAPSLRLALTTIFVLRLLLRVLPPTFDGIERLQFHAMVAARHLRSKKSGFLAFIGTLSIAAVALSTCMLVTVLSVMGGFRNDLKEKILGNHAHIVVERDGQRAFEGWGATLEAARATEEVVAATPFIQGEVMVTSASNQAGAVLRGIEVETVGEVTDLVRNLERGDLAYLSHPERLLHLPPEERRTILPLELNPTRDNDDEGIVREIQEAVEALDAPEVPKNPFEDEPFENEPFDGETPAGSIQDLFPADDGAETTSADVLPGVIVGRELARTLRLFVGDELDIVSPFGELGPAGPMPKARRFRVAGIFYSGMYEYDMKQIYVTLEDGQRFLSTGGAIHGIEVKVDEVERAERVAASLRGAIHRDDLEVRDWKELNKNLFGALKLEKLAMFVTLGIAILIAGFCVFGTLTLMVQEKGREVAILQAMGAGPRSVIAVFLFEGALIGVLGAGIGLGWGYLLTFIFEHFGLRLDPEVYYIDRLPVHVDPMDFIAVGIAAVAVCIVATIFPAHIASRMRPVDALRYQ